MSHLLDMRSYQAIGVISYTATVAAGWGVAWVSPLFAQADPSKIVSFGVLLTVLATGLAGIIAAVGKAIVNAIREYRDLNAESDAGKLRDCLAAKAELEEHLKEVRAAFIDIRALCDARGEELLAIRSDRLDLRGELKELNLKYRALVEQLARNNEVLSSQAIPKEVKVVLESGKVPPQGGLNAP
jgi:hypothetical protein